ncbi:hypothetical protein BH10PSE1_BH10PSE1_00920 [soil metagenome]
MLGRTTKHREQFATAIKAARGAQAEVEDLRRSRALLEMLGRLDMKARDVAVDSDVIQDPDDAAWGHAAYLSALILYVRATERRSNHKPRPDYESTYSPEERKEHGHLSRLRDDALAHWGPGPDRFGVSHHEITIFTDANGTPRALLALANYRADVVNMIYRLSEVALAAAYLKLQREMAGVSDRLAALLDADPAAVALSRECVILDDRRLAMWPGEIDHARSPGRVGIE